MALLCYKHQRTEIKLDYPENISEHMWAEGRYSLWHWSLTLPLFSPMKFKCLQDLKLFSILNCKHVFSEDKQWKG